jgi:hypothetical protein
MRGRVLRHHDGAMIEEPTELVPGELCGGGVALKRARQLVLRSLLLCSVERLAPSVALSQLVKNDEIMHVLVQLITSPRKPCTDCRECIMYDRPCFSDCACAASCSGNTPKCSNEDNNYSWFAHPDLSNKTVLSDCALDHLSTIRNLTPEQLATRYGLGG